MPFDINGGVVVVCINAAMFIQIHKFTTYEFGKQRSSCAEYCFKLNDEKSDTICIETGGVIGYANRNFFENEMGYKIYTPKSFDEFIEILYKYHNYKPTYLTPWDFYAD